MKLKELLEEWKASVKYSSKKSYDIFVNPDSKELRDLGRSEKENYIRYIIDFKKKKLYIFSSELVHDLASTELGIPYDFNHKVVDYKFGEAFIKNGKIMLTAYDMVEVSGKKWLQKYFKEM